MPALKGEEVFILLLFGLFYSSKREMMQSVQIVFLLFLAGDGRSLNTYVQSVRSA